MNPMTEEQKGESPSHGEGDAMRTCPRCGQRLQPQACKLRCPDPACGFFLSCSDYL